MATVRTEVVYFPVLFYASFGRLEGEYMFGFTGPSQYDLRFSLFGIPVYVNPMFWVIGAVLGWGVVATPGMGPVFLVNWIFCLFISILIHELGHAIIAKAFGWPPQIFLYHMGGLAAYSPDSGHTTGRSIAISFAGPAAGFVLYGIVLGCEWLLFYSPDPLIHKITSSAIVQRHLIYLTLWLKHINLYWGLVNLLPVLPLDGGRICESICMESAGSKGREWALKVSIGVAGLAAAYFFMTQNRFAGFFFAYMCYTNFNAYQMSQRGYW